MTKITAKGCGTVLVCMVALSLTPATVIAGKKAEAEDAMSMVLFELEEIRPEEIVYEVNNRGVVFVTFDNGVPKELQEKFVERLRVNPGINGANVDSADICADIKR